jgi:hypothetical protein
MEKKTLLAVYEDIVHATNVVADLRDENIRRQDIGLAVRKPSESEKEPSEALVTVTIPTEMFAQTVSLMEHHDPIKFDIRDAQWRLTDEPPFEPNEDAFMAVGAKKSIRS